LNAPRCYGHRITAGPLDRWYPNLEWPAVFEFGRMTMTQMVADILSKSGHRSPPIQWSSDIQSSADRRQKFEGRKIMAIQCADDALPLVGRRCRRFKSPVISSHSLIGGKKLRWKKMVTHRSRDALLVDGRHCRRSRSQVISCPSLIGGTNWRNADVTHFTVLCPAQQWSRRHRRLSVALETK